MVQYGSAAGGLAACRATLLLLSAVAQKQQLLRAGLGPEQLLRAGLGQLREGDAAGRGLLCPPDPRGAVRSQPNTCSPSVHTAREANNGHTPLKV